MKPVLIFMLGLAIGAGVMFALKPDHAVEARDAQKAERGARAQVVALTAEVENVRAELGRTEQEVDSMRTALDQSTARAAEAAAAAKLTTPAPEGEKKKKFTDMLKEIGKSQMKSQLDGKVASLKDRLRLTPEQEAKVKELVGQEGEQMVKALERFVDGEGQAGDFAKIARFQKGDLPASVEAILTSEQKPAYAAFEAEEKANRIEMKANAELLGLQSAGGLSPEQKDQAFAQLSQLAMREEEMDLDSLSDSDAVLGFIDDAIQKRLTAMKTILNDSQMEIYQRQVEMQRQMMSQFIPPSKK